MSKIPLLLPDGSLNPAHERCGEEYADMVSGGAPRRINPEHARRQVEASNAAYYAWRREEAAKAAAEPKTRTGSW